MIANMNKPLKGHLAVVAFLVSIALSGSSTFSYAHSIVNTDGSRRAVTATCNTDRTLKFMAAYFRAVNAQDPMQFAKLYATSAVFERTDNRFTGGRDQYVPECLAAHDGLSETICSARVLVDCNNAAAEMNIDLIASKDQPTSIIMPLKSGDHFMDKMFGFYTIERGLITYIKVSRWAPNQE